MASWERERETREYFVARHRAIRYVSFHSVYMHDFAIKRLLSLLRHFESSCGRDDLSSIYSFERWSSASVDISSDRTSESLINLYIVYNFLYRYIRPDVSRINFFVVRDARQLDSIDRPGTRVRARDRAYVCVAFRFIFCYTILSTTRGKNLLEEMREEDVSVLFKPPFWGLPIKRPIELRIIVCKSNLSRSRILCVSLDLTRCLANRS